ncbi:DUF6884 domain-containing protein [Streptomyces sp. NBC_00120]|uniref:DUF6884 domain-containing protein n=1 Tax=Streptomyces sp. NBC_00120 TaxID=2975660 RepID=UPI0022525471|nr:DUF6884 domain-containing protein [Streptomyces sp. NBC_00120]MCX5326319.1 hypothetical protein [Streptomyces sp. NBC_00120]
MTTAPPYARPGHVYVIPCSGKKLDRAAPARELYTGSYFHACWRAADALAEDGDRILVLSARHGLVSLDDVLEPYDTRFGDREEVSDLLLDAQARRLGIQHAREVTVLAGSDYVQAARKVWPYAKAPLTGLAIGRQLQRLNELSSKAATVAAHPVESLAERGPLYDVPADYGQRERPFTVAVAGPGRSMGEKPSLYVAAAYSSAQAWAKVLGWYMVEHETPDAYVVAGESFEGEPQPGDRYFWTDLRSEFARQEALDDLADQAAEVVECFQAETLGMTSDGDVLPDRQDEYGKARARAQEAAWPLVQQMADNDGR